MRRAMQSAVGLVAALSLVFLAGPTGVASAAGLTGYGPGGGVAAITVTVNEAAECATIAVTGSGFGGNKVVGLVVSGSNLGTATIDASGSFTETVTLPSGLASGSYTVVATGHISGTTAAASFVLTEATCAAQGNQNGTGGGGVTPSSPSTGSGLAFTGTDAVAVSAAGAIALAVGGLLVLASRRRRDNNWA